MRLLRATVIRAQRRRAHQEAGYIERSPIPASSDKDALATQGESIYRSQDMRRLDNIIDGFEGEKEAAMRRMEQRRRDLESAQAEIGKLFDKEQEYLAKKTRHAEVMKLLSETPDITEGPALSVRDEQYSRTLAPTAETLTELRAKYGDIEDQFRAGTGYGFDAVTESEARALLKYSPAQSVRDRITEAARARNRRASGERSGNPADRGLDDDTALAVREPSPPFYSAAIRAVEALPQAKASGPQWYATISQRPGVRPEELEWMGLKE